MSIIMLKLPSTAGRYTATGHVCNLCSVSPVWSTVRLLHWLLISYRYSILLAPTSKLAILARHLWLPVYWQYAADYFFPVYWHWLGLPVSIYWQTVYWQYCLPVEKPIPRAQYSLHREECRL